MHVGLGGGTQLGIAAGKAVSELYNRSATAREIASIINRGGTSGIGTAAFFMVILTFAIRAQLRPVEVGREALVGRIGDARTRLSPTGMVHVAGELWTAILEDESETLEPGTRVEIVGMDGLRLQVKPTSKKQ